MLYETLLLSLNRGIYVDFRGALRRCVPWQCDQEVEITDALKVDKVARIVGMYPPRLWSGTDLGLRLIVVALRGDGL